MMSLSYEFNKAITGIDILSPPEQYIAKLLSVICNYLGYSFGSVIKIGYQGRESIISSYNLPENYSEQMKEINASLLSSPLGEAISKGEIVVVNDLLSDSRLAPWYDIIELYALKTIVWVPLMSKGKFFGVYALCNTKVHNVSAEELQKLEEIALPISIAIISNQYLDDLNQSRKELEHEILERKRSEKELEILMDDLKHANKDLEDFASVVSHDLRAPLRGISSVVSWLSESYAHLLDNQGRKYLGLIVSQTRRLNDLIEGILRYSRMGRSQGDPQWLDSSTFVGKIINDLSPPRTISVSAENPLPFIFYDTLFLQQVLQNLLINAIKHLGKPKGKVVISCLDIGDFWEFCVKDNGVGIEERHFERIFKMFQSLKPRDEMKSTGIGLSLVKRIVENNGGKLRVESVLGEGSAFFFTVHKLGAFGISAPI